MALRWTATPLVALVLCLLAGAAGVAGGQNAAAPATATVGGQVTFDENGARLPLRRATVTLENRAAKIKLNVATDKDGAFRFKAVEPGTYRLIVEKAGFVALAPPAQLAVGNGAVRTESLRVQRAAAIEGRFLEDSGNPIAGLPVFAERIDASENDTSPRTLAAETDDLGRFRIHTLPPGKYIVHATPPTPASGEQLFYPGTEKRDSATVLSAISGQTIDNIFVNVPTSQPQAVIGETLATQELERTSKPPGGGEWAQVSGRVTRSDNGAPVPNAAVKLSTSYGLALRTVWTDGAGDYTITRVIAGNYLIAAAASGYHYAGAVVARNGPPVDRIEVASGDRLKKAIGLIPLGAVEGRLLDEYGDPAPGVVIRVIAMTQSLEPRARPNVLLTGPTDDRGWFRAHSMTAGDYHLCAVPEPFARSGPALFPTTCLPGTTSLDAAMPITITPGIEERSLSMGLPAVASAMVTGSVVDPGGQPVAGMSVELQPAQQGPRWIPFRARVETDAEGRFVYPNVPEGTYIVETMANETHGSTSATVDVSAASEPRAVVISVRALPVARGRVIFEGGTPPQPKNGRGLAVISLQPLRLGNFSVAGWPTSAELSQDGTFELRGLRSEGLIRASPRIEGAAWIMSRVTHHGRDVTDIPLDVTSGDIDGLEIILTRRLGDVTGTVVESKPADRTLVVLFGADSTSPAYLQRTMRQTRANEKGTFAFPLLLPGRYFVVTPAAYSLEAILALRANATPVLVTEGTETQVRLTVVK